MGGRDPWNTRGYSFPLTALSGAYAGRSTLVPEPGVHDSLEGVKIYIKIGGFLHIGGGPELQTVVLLSLFGRRTQDDNGYLQIAR